MTIDEYNAQYLELPLDRMPTWNALMTSNMSGWPDPLKSHVQEVLSRLGGSGDVISCAVADWLKANPEYKCNI